MSKSLKNAAPRGSVLKAADAIDTLLKKQFKLEAERSAISLEKDMLLSSGANTRHQRIKEIDSSLVGIGSKLSTISTELTKQQARLSRRVVLAFAGVMFVLFVISYMIIKLYQPDFGHDIKVGYYEALANILAALLIALFLTPNEEGAPKKKRALSVWTLVLSGGKLEGLFGFTVGVLACLVAIATSHQGTALFLATIFSILIIIPITFNRIIRGKLD